MSDTTTPRVTTERARELLAGNCHRFANYEPVSGWSGPTSDVSAIADFGHDVQHHRDEGADDGWHDDVESVAVYRLVPIRSVTLTQIATSDDDSPDGERCRAAGWDYMATLTEHEHADEVADLAADLIDARAEIARLTAERDKANANYRFMVERAADASLEGYRELGARAAAAENERDALRADLAEVRKYAEAVRAEIDTLTKQRDNAFGYVESIEGALNGAGVQDWIEHWSGHPEEPPSAEQADPLSRVMMLVEERDALKRDLIVARERIAALEAEQDARVTAEEHAREIRGVFWRQYDCDTRATPFWMVSKTRADLIATLTRHVGPKRAAELADGAGGES